MVTFEVQHINESRAKFSFYGLSTDEKPTGKYIGVEIANGSTFLEVDTHSIKFYDEEGAQWA